MKHAVRKPVIEVSAGRNGTKLDNIDDGSRVVEHYNIYHALDDVEGLDFPKMLVRVNVAGRRDGDEHLVQPVVVGPVRTDPRAPARVGSRLPLEERDLRRTHANDLRLGDEHFVVDLAKLDSGVRFHG